MPGAFHNAVKGVTGSAPGTGNYTPSAAAAACRAWSNVQAGWMGLVRFDDTGSAWEYSYCYWNGTAIVRTANGFVESSSGSQLSLTVAATAAMVIDAAAIGENNLNSGRGWFAGIAGTTMNAVGLPPATVAGTAAGFAVTNTDFPSTQPRIRYSSATTANASAGVSTAMTVATSSTTAGQGGFRYKSRFGVSQTVTGPRFIFGVGSATYAAAASDPSAVVGDSYLLIKDSTDTNFQLFHSRSGPGALSTKYDTGIPLVLLGWYEIEIWQWPGSLDVYYKFFRLDTGAIFYKKVAANANSPATGAQYRLHALGSLSATTGTALIMNLAGVAFPSNF